MVSFEGVSFAYDHAQEDALEDIDLRIPKGEFLCILGSNGSGKTTLAKMVNGLLIPKSGKVTTCSLDTSIEENLLSIRQDAGMVFQNPDDQLIGNSIEDDVAFGPENLRLPSPEIQERVKKSLKSVGLHSFAQHETRKLSGGQKQRVAIAAALAMDPQVLILDEAGSMLDPRGRTDLMKACRKLNRDGLTIICVTHFLSEAAEADRVIVMSDGSIVESGSTKEILENGAMLKKLDLDTPFSVSLCHKLADIGVDVGVHLHDDDLIESIKRHGFSSELANAHLKESEEPFIAAGAPSDVLVEVEDVSFSYMDKRALKRAMKAGRRRLDDQASDASADSKRGSFGASHDVDVVSTSSDIDGLKWGVDPESVWAIRDLSFEIRNGDFFGVAGHTGSGKSTLLRLLAGLADPTRGSISIKGMPIGTKDGKKLVRETVGIVMQYPEKQLFAETVFKDCAFGPINLGLEESEVEERVKNALKMVGLDDQGILEKSPFQLSGGQQRRVAIAGVLAMYPKILILDEPTAGLDPAGCRSLMALIKNMHDKHGVTIIMVSHNMDNISAFCNKVLVLNKGLKFLEGSPIHVFSNEYDLCEVGLGPPSALRIADKLGIKGFKTVPNIEQLSQAIKMGIPFQTSPSSEDRETTSCAASARDRKDHE